MMCGRECPAAVARPAVQHGEARHLQEGALLMLLPRGGRADNGWRKGDELCHQTRGLKDGPLERYPSCLDQDVRLPRSSLLFLLPSLARPVLLSPLSSSSPSVAPLLPLPVFSFLSFILSLPLSSFSLSSLLLFSLIQGRRPVTPPAPSGPCFVWVRFLFQTKLLEQRSASQSLLPLVLPLPRPTDVTK